MKDIDESLAFYTDVLGFEPGEDVKLGDDFRWCTVVHPKQPELKLHVTTPARRSPRSWSPPCAAPRTRAASPASA
ncbi:MAG TPA: VOC family protein [Nocardioides sp.]|nr:VOC family protein [Nocardioides sp.]